MARKFSIIDKESEITILEPNYQGISNLINSIAELYKVCDRKELVDNIIETTFMNPRIIIKTDSMMIDENENNKEK